MAFEVSHQWQKEGFFITTEALNEQFDQVNSLFDGDDFHWGKALPNKQIQTMIQHSICFWLFEGRSLTNTSSIPSEEARPRLVGMGRWITDRVTVVYVNDIYIVQEHRGKGLAKWMLGCMNELLGQMPDLRGTIMIVEKDTPTEKLYKQHFAMEDLVATDVLLDRKGPGSAYSEV